MPLIGSLLKPTECNHIILHGTIAIGIAHCKIILGRIQTLNGRLLVPIERLIGILLHSITEEVTVTHLVAGNRITRRCCAIQIIESHDGIGLDALALPVADTNICHGHSIALPCCKAVPFDGLLKIMFHTVTLMIAVTDIALCDIVALLRRLPEP